MGRALNLTAQENFLSALKIAEQRDEELRLLKDEGEEAMEEKLGPLHGIPLIVKDSIYQQGKVSSFGMAYLCEDPVDSDSLMLRQYMAAGAIPLVRSNVAAGDLLAHSSNPVFGDSINPLD